MAFVSNWLKSADVSTLAARRDVRGLIRSLRRDDPNVRRAAIEALGRLGDKRAVAPLIAQLEDEPTAAAAALAQTCYQRERAVANAQPASRPM